MAGGVENWFFRNALVRRRVLPGAESGGLGEREMNPAVAGLFAALRTKREREREREGGMNHAGL